MRFMITTFLKKQFYLTGLNPRILFRSLTGFPAFLGDLNKYQRRNKDVSFKFRLADVFPILSDKCICEATWTSMWTRVASCDHLHPSPPVTIEASSACATATQPIQLPAADGNRCSRAFQRRQEGILMGIRVEVLTRLSL